MRTLQISLSFLRNLKMTKGAKSDDESSLELSSESANDFESDEDSVPQEKSNPTKSAIKQTAPAQQTNSKRKLETPAPSIITKPERTAAVVRSMPVSSSASSSSSSSMVATNVVNVEVVQFEEDITRGPDITSESAAKKLILKYLSRQNRPYSAIQIYDNLHHRIAKSVVEKILNNLPNDTAGEVVIRCKEYGKAKIYFVDQSHLDSTATPADLAALDSQLQKLTKEVSVAQAKCKLLTADVSTAEEFPPDDALDDLIAAKERDVSVKRARLSVMTGGGGGGGSKQSLYKTMSEAVKAHNFYRAQWQSRRQICLEVVESLAEGLSKKTKDLLVELAVETDQDAAVSLPAVIKEPVPGSKR